MEVATPSSAPDSLACCLPRCYCTIEQSNLDFAPRRGHTRDDRWAVASLKFHFQHLEAELCRCSLALSTSTDLYRDILKAWIYARWEVDDGLEPADARTKKVLSLKAS